eukprot:6464492-Amphidinium_carterae.1
MQTLTCVPMDLARRIYVWGQPCGFRLSQTLGTARKRGSGSTPHPAPSPEPCMLAPSGEDAFAAAWTQVSSAIPRVEIDIVRGPLHDLLSNTILAMELRRRAQLIRSDLGRTWSSTDLDLSRFRGVEADAERPLERLVG